jgi:carbohydrate diacid regulator
VIKLDLNPELAQKIVKKTMNVLGKNINIMNHDGIIIASGNTKRLNTYHEIAVRVLDSGKPYIINKTEAESYKGVKEGINLPIKFQEKIIGVVGITGNTNEVAGYGEIVKNMVELILQQEFLLREIEIENKAKEYFFQQLLSNSIEEEDLFNDRINLLNIKTDCFRVVLVINIKPFNNKRVSYEIQNLSSVSTLISEDDVILIRGKYIVLIKVIKDVDSQKQSENILKVAKKVKNYFQDGNAKVVIGIGHIFKELNRLSISYQGAKQALKVGEKVYKSYSEDKKDIYYLNRLGFDFFLPAIENEAAEYYLHHLFDRNIAYIFEKNDIGVIIEELAENNLNISKTANKLYIHRNTLLYRIEKINDLTGLNPKKLKDLYSLLFAYHMYKYQN